MELRYYHIDAFTSRLFGGNPAIVCLLPEWLADEQLQAIAAENNVSETAFLVTGSEPFPLRWFTPRQEVDLCGHATLAAGFVLLRILWPGRNEVRFSTRSGELLVKQEGEALAMTLPAFQAELWEPPEGMLEALGGEPLEVLRANYALVVYDTEREIRQLRPDFRALERCGAPPVIVTAAGDEADYVCRFFAPSLGIDEDPATGSAQSALVPFWAKRRCKWWLEGRQLSARGGWFRCEDRGETVVVQGHAVLYSEGTIHL